MRPYLLKGHERPLTQIKFNREGDLLFSCAKDHNPTLWFSDDGSRVGTYVGHNGAVNSCDVTWDSKHLITASSDSTVRLWDVETGKELHTFQFTEPCRAVKLSVGDKMAAFTTDPFMETPSAIYIVDLADDPKDQVSEPRLKIKGPKGKISKVEWTDLNSVLITAGDDGFVRRWDAETGKLLEENKVHEKEIKDIRMSKDGSHFISASSDKTAKLIDTQTLEPLRTFYTGRPVNSADMSPIYNHVLLGGGQDAMDVTLQGDQRAGKFESRFFHKVYGDELGSVRGHFGPINAVAFHPDGRSFVTGGEDGYIRLHHFDNDYFTLDLK